MPGSGKSVCAAHLESLGYFQFRFGSIVVNEVARRGWPLTPENERIVREELRARDGMAAIARLALPVLRDALDSQPCIVIDGLYSWSEYRLLKQELDADLVIVAVVSQRALRYARLAARRERPLSAQEAETRDIAEIEYLEKGGPIALADFTLLNNRNRSNLVAQLTGVLDEIGFCK
jgi:dephospho-CoA kinase